LELLPGGLCRCWGEVLGVSVRGVEGVNERVNSSTISTWGYSTPRVTVNISTKVASVHIVLEVPVCGVVGVDEGVDIGRTSGLGRGKVLLGLLGKALSGDKSVTFTIKVFIIIVGASRSLGDLLGLLGELLGLLLGLWGLLGLSNVRGGLESVGSKWNMVTLEDFEPVLTSAVFHSNLFPICVDVTVLSDSFSISSGLLSINSSILLGIGSSESPVPSVESLLLQNFGLCSRILLGQCSSGQA